MAVEKHLRKIATVRKSVGFSMTSKWLFIDCLAQCETFHMNEEFQEDIGL